MMINVKMLFLNSQEKKSKWRLKEPTLTYFTLAYTVCKGSLVHLILFDKCRCVTLRRRQWGAVSESTLMWLSFERKREKYVAELCLASEKKQHLAVKCSFSRETVAFTEVRAASQKPMRAAYLAEYMCWQRGSMTLSVWSGSGGFRVASEHLRDWLVRHLGVCGWVMAGRGCRLLGLAGVTLALTARCAALTGKHFP